MIIEIVWTFFLKSVPAKFQKHLKHISWVISGTSSSKLSCNPRQPSRNISCNHRHNLLQPSWRRIFSTSINRKTKVDSDILSDYKVSSFDKRYIRLRKMRQRALLGHTNWNIEMRSPSALLHVLQLLQISSNLPPPPPPPPLLRFPVNLRRNRFMLVLIKFVFLIANPDSESYFEVLWSTVSLIQILDVRNTAIYFSKKGLIFRKSIEKDEKLFR